MALHQLVILPKRQDIKSNLKTFQDKPVLNPMPITEAE